jgi:arylsulfatase A-like enzyme
MKWNWIVILLATLSFALPDVQAAEQPNILFIMVDDLGKDWISCYGADNIQTPHIDKLAKSGLKFHNAYSMPQCTPTRVTLLTGQYPWRTGWVNHWDVPRWGVGYFDWQRYTTFASVMKNAGYVTAIGGKWQINDFRVEPNALEKHGFDDWCVWTGYEGQNPPSGNRYWDPYIHTRQGSKTYKGEFGPDIYCNFLIDFMKSHRDDPMMLYFPLALTHGPMTHTPTEPDVSGRDRFAAMVRYTDLLVGRLVAAVDALDLRQRTIIIFTTDNGTSGGLLGTVGGKRPSGGKAKKYEGGVCEPFIVNCPGRVPAGAETDALTDFSDLLPTFAELGGAKLPANLVLDGKSVAQVMLGKAADSPREWIMALGHGAAKLDAKGVRGVDDYADRVIRDKRYKVWIEPNRKISAFYDLQEDPLERNNLLGSQLSDPAKKSLAKFLDVMKTMPADDARPQYRPRKALPWDKTLSADKNSSSGKSRPNRRRGKKKDPST